MSRDSTRTGKRTRDLKGESMELDHWYDGAFYDRFIAPNQDAAFERVKELVAPGTSVLDAGCGTGRLVLQLSGRCSFAVGVDPSQRNIATAERSLHRQHVRNARFHHADVVTFLRSSAGKFDHATISYVLHEIDEDQRSPVLMALASAASSVILVDYLVPQPAGFHKAMNLAVEFAAGREHFRNFMSFVKTGGLRGLVDRAGLTVVREITGVSPTSHIMEVARPPG
jgi:SAM-dependent methyltransferase